MKFSYESSLARLSDEEFGVLYLMALSDNPSPRRRLAAITHDEDTLTAAIDLLDQRHLIRRSNNEERNKVLFRIFDNTLRDYVKSQARHRLTMERKRDIEQQAGVVPSRAQSESIGIEIDRVIMQAEHTAQTDRRKAIDLLEQAVGQFGEDPKLLTSLGYWHYREYNRSMARKLLERAIEAGSDLPDTFAILAEVQFYERQYGDGLAHARQALNYSRSHPKANQIAAQCLLELVDRSRLQYDVRRRLELVKEARTHAQRSIIADDWSPGANASNRRAEDLIRRAEELLDGGQRAG